jgi:hypothetical protein
VFREPGAKQATLLDGMHRWRVSRFLGLSLIPCFYESRAEAEGRYGYVSSATAMTNETE